MLSKDYSRFNSLKLSLDHLVENEDIIKDNGPLMAAVASAKSLLSGIVFHNEVAITKSDGAREEKKSDQERLADHAMIMAGAISSWAASQGNNELKEAMNFTRSELIYGTDIEVTERCGLIRTNAEKYKDALTAAGFSAALMDGFIRVVSEFGASVQRPRELKVEKRQAASMVKRLIKDCEKHFKEHIDKLVTVYKLTQIVFYEQYRLKRVIINPPTRHTALSGTITDKVTGKPLEGVVIMAGESQMATKSGVDGNYRLQVPLFGKLTFHFHKDGYKSVSEPVILKKGKETVLAVQMEPVV